MGSDSDTDESFKKLNETKNSEDETVIDESGDESIDSPAFIKIKKRAAVITDSDSEDDDTLNHISSSTKELKTQNRKVKALISDSSSNNDHTLNDISTPGENLQKPFAENLSGNRPPSLNKEVEESSSSFEDTCENTGIESYSKSDSEPELVIEKTGPTDAMPEINKSPDPLNLSEKFGNKRISHQFEFNSEGILNSTSIHFAGQNPGKWRPSNAFRDIGEIEDLTEDKSVEVLSDDSSDIIEVSSSEGIVSPLKLPLKTLKPKNIIQPTLHTFVNASPSTPKPVIKKLTEPSPQPPSTNKPKTLVSGAKYEAQSSKVDDLEMYFNKVKSIVDNVDIESLPDKGQLLTERLRTAEDKYLEAKRILDDMEVSDEIQEEAKEGILNNVAWDDIQAGANAVLPKTFGKKALSTYNAQKAVTMDRLQQLHGALQTCPKEEDTEDDPKGLKVSLMPHQKRALAWLMFREKEIPSGGILADDMGLGKTLTMLSLILKCKQIDGMNNDSDEENKERNQYISKKTRFDGGSLIICPASLLNQWSGEIDRRMKRGLISYNLYHGPKRESNPKYLSEYDVVITTYSIVNNENDKNSALYKIKWRRIILDEAHQIRNHKAQTSEACCQLFAKSRWALTGTPMHNKEMDMYALLKFLRCTPFDDLQVWKRWIGDKSRGGRERLHTVISSLMLRRTKVELIEKGALNFIPEKKWLLVKVQLDDNEMKVYHKVLIFSQTLFSQFLHQRAEKNQDYAYKYNNTESSKPNEEYFKMREKLLKLNKVKNVSQHEILVLILRLRQICCHPSLITAMLDEGLDDVDKDEQEREELNLLDQLEKLDINDQDEEEYKAANETNAPSDNSKKVNLKEAAKGHLRSSDPIFAKDRISSKIKQMLQVLKSEVLSKGDKAIIVSQWSSYLNLVGIQLKENDIKFVQLDGTVPVIKRVDLVDKINNPQDTTRVLLLSLTAGGVGLNLVGANHLFLLDLHWNPQLENQAQDRIYRVGQTKPVFVYKFMAVDTIEERIKFLQEKKLEMAEGVLTGTRQVVENKLSIEDLRMIFQM